MHDLASATYCKVMVVQTSFSFFLHKCTIVHICIFCGKSVWLLLDSKEREEGWLSLKPSLGKTGSGETFLFDWKQCCVSERVQANNIETFRRSFRLDLKTANCRRQCVPLLLSTFTFHIDMLLKRKKVSQERVQCPCWPILYAVCSCAFCQVAKTY